MTTALQSDVRRQMCDTAFDRQSLERLQSTLPADDGELDLLITHLLAENDAAEFIRVIFAALGADRLVQAKHLRKGAIPLVQSEWLTDVAIRLQGDVAQYLLEALENEWFDAEGRISILLTVALWCFERAHVDVPPQLFLHVRALCRGRLRDLNVVGRLTMLVLYIKDDALLQLLRKQYYFTLPEKVWETECNKTMEPLVNLFSSLSRKPLLDYLPEKRRLRIGRGGTVRRSVAQIGRNEPCPCGAGKKYKQCCLGRDQERLRHSTDIAGVTHEEMAATPERWLTPERLGRADIHDVQKFDPLKVPPATLHRYLLRLAQRKLFDRLAESFDKIGFSMHFFTAWSEGVRRAAISGRKDIAQRLINLRNPSGLREEQLPRGVYFLMIEDDAEKALAYLENAVCHALKTNDVGKLSELAQSVTASKFPALGIALARGVAPLASPSDAADLMDDLLRARDRLNLAPDDAIQEVLDTLSTRAEDDAGSSDAYRELQETFDAQRRESHRVNEELERMKRQVKWLERTQPTETDGAAATVPAAVQTKPDLGRYERKIAHLEEEAKASRESEWMLRHQMQRMQRENEELKQKAAESVKTVAADAEMDREEELLLQSEAQATQPVRLIEFAHHFESKLLAAPRHIARATMAMLGGLAGGEPAVFVGAVRLKACPAIMRHRISHDWRLLFRLRDTRLEVIDLIPRQKLERRIKTLAGQYNG